MTTRYVVYDSPFKLFRPLSSTPATCLTRDLHPSMPAQCLLLGCGDPRNILYTLYYDAKGSNTRSFDFTCCDIESAVIARNVMLFTLILDGDLSTNIWIAMYELFIDESTFKMIKSQAKKLLALSKTSQTWNNSQYSKVIRFVNSETLELLGGYWVNYSNEENTTEAFNNRCRDAVKVSSANHRSTRTISEPTTLLFWRDRPADLHCNPLFAYSDASGNRFAVHKDTNPYAGFHALPGLHYSEVISCAVEQFLKWCIAFFETKSLTIRFFIGDAMALCLGLTELDDPISPANCYSRPGSSRPLRIDNKDYSSNLRNRAPTKFNVIDTAHLTDTVGLLNLFPTTVSFLQSTTSVLYTSSRQNTDLATLLCGDPSIMCSLFGVAPVSHLCGVTTSVGKRITWRMGKSGDAILQWSQVKPTGKTEEVAAFLWQVYNRMFPGGFFDSPVRTQIYTKTTFFALVLFLERRVFCNWGRCIASLGQLLPEVTMDKVEHHAAFDFSMQCSLITQMPAEMLDEHPTYNIVWLREPKAQYSAVILTVPRFRLREIYKRLEQTPSLKISFQIYMQMTNADLPNTFSSTHVVFGKVISSTDGTTGTVQVDPAGWHGDSDLQVCGFMYTCVLGMWGNFPEHVFGARLYPSEDVRKVFADFAPSGNPNHLPVFRTGLEHGNNGVYFFKALPGLREPEPKFTGKSLVYPKVAVRNSNFVVEFPKLGLESKDFTTKVDLLGAARDSLKQGAQVSVLQRSPCTLAVTFGSYDLQCNYISPITSSGSKLRVSRTSGWIEVIAPLSGPSSLGHFRLNPFPLCRSPDYNIYGFHFPYLSFDKLTRFDPPEPWLKHHLQNMFSYQPIDLIAKDVITGIKKHIQAFFSYSTRVIRLSWNGQSIVYFRGSTYFDEDTRSIVARAYVLPVPKSFTIPATELEVTENEIQFWRSALPGLIERSRTWEHVADKCEYVLADIVRPGTKSICSCGEGNVHIDFAKEWKDYESKVTPFAMPALFGEFYIGPGVENVSKKVATDDSSNANVSEKVTNDERTANVSGNASCHVYSKVHAKKCGKCLSVSYCSRECQAKDWKMHKLSCRAKN